MVDMLTKTAIVKKLYVSALLTGISISFLFPPEPLSFGRGQKKMCSGNVPSSLNDDLGGISYVDFDTKLRHKSQFCFRDIWDILNFVPAHYFSSNFIGPNNFSTRLWYVFKGLQNHHFLMVSQLAFQLNYFSLKLILI
jgi:hypothetical protein